MRDIYCISGLGADHRIFSRLDVPEVRFLPLPWLTPDVEESIGCYAARMKAGISTAAPVFLGVSFGGMMALEIAKSYVSPTVIIISSIGDHRQLPYWMQVSGRLQLNRVAPVGRQRRLSLPEKYYMGVETSEDAALVKAFKTEADPVYLKWAVSQILNWQNEWRPTSFYHIHGGRDRIFPLRRVQPTHIIPDGGHLMIHNRADAVSAMLTGIFGGNK
jgi:pimeloyl-ACP methyl ester carboxylesterase